MQNKIIISVLLLVILAQGVYIVTRKAPTKQVLGIASTATSTPTPTPNPARTILTKGMKLADSPIAKFAYKIAPGDLSTDAQTALNGFEIKNETQKDGTIIVTLTSKDSDDQSQIYRVEKGYSLYFVEMTPVDDKDNKDLNLRDDYGIIVDGAGVVQ